MSKQRPWGWIVWRAMAEPEIERCKPKDGDYVLCEPLYTVPPARKPLTDEQIDAEFDRECWVTVVFADGTKGIALDRVTARDFARAIERAHGIGEA